jgi:D-hydroxyproline dehydrogenase subunit gamma
MSSALAASVARKQVEIVVDGASRVVPAGVTVAVALLLTRDEGAALGHTVFCGMGSCYECVAVVNGVPGVRTCITPVAEHMRVDTRGPKSDG